MAGDLVILRGIKCFLRYAVEGLPGAMSHPFLAAPAFERLLAAQALIASEVRGVELLVWDAFRTRETQRAIFERYRAELVRCHPGASNDELNTRTRQFVSDPDGVFPHGTGGAVDVTLVSGGETLWMGTDFDEFVPQSASDWFRLHPPTNPAEWEAHKNRELLRKAMEESGFVGISSEWWHFEYETKTWSEQNGKQYLGKVFDPPVGIGPSVTGLVPRHQPALEAGVAQIFTTAERRREGLAHVSPAHYYQRESHPTTANLAGRVSSMLGASSDPVLFQSGKAACIATLKALTPDRGRILHDRAIYYEIHRELLALATRNGWGIVSSDFTDLEALRRMAWRGAPFDILYLDSPRNWFLDTINISEVANIARRAGAVLVVDVSVHPLQDALKCGADVVVCSLSKYPSGGLDMGGAVASTSKLYLDRVKSLASAEGHVLGSATAYAIWTQMITLDDRFAAASEKSVRIATALRLNPAIKAVHVPNPQLLGGLVGGQISFRMKEPSHGRLLEQIVEFHALDDDAALHLMCTFGACTTAIEHFASNPRYRDGIARGDTNEVLIPSEMVRLGIGAEPAERILDQLTFALNTVLDYNAKSSSNLLHSKTA